MSAKNIMNKPVVTVELDDTLKVVKEIFDNTRFHHLLVVEAGVLVGVISDRDLLKAISPNIGTAAEKNNDLATLTKKVHQVMTRKPVVLGPDAALEDAITIFNRYTISCIPVVDDAFKPVGIISWRDILRALAATA